MDLRESSLRTRPSSDSLIAPISPTPCPCPYHHKPPVSSVSVFRDRDSTVDGELWIRVRIGLHCVDMIVDKQFGTISLPQIRSVTYREKCRRRALKHPFDGLEFPDLYESDWYGPSHESWREEQTGNLMTQMYIPTSVDPRGHTFSEVEERVLGDPALRS